MAAELSEKRISLLLTAAAIALWGFGMTQARLTLDGYGLIRSLPVSFFIALGLVTIASAMLWVSRVNHGRLLFLQLVFLITAIWLTPLLVGGVGAAHPVVTDSFYDYGNAEYIIRQGHSAPDVLWRLSWPGLFILVTFLNEVIGIGQPSVLVATFPLLSHLLYLLPLYLIFKNTIGNGESNLHWAALWIFYLGISGSYGGIHTQTLASMFLLILVVILTGSQFWQTRFVGLLAYMIVFASLITTHLVTPLYALFATMALWITKRLRTGTFIVIGAVMIIAWMLYGAASFFEGNLSVFVNRIFMPRLLWEISVQDRLTGSPSHQIVVQIRLLTATAFVLLGVVGFIVGRRKKNRSDLSMIAIAVSGGLLAVVLGVSNGFDVLHRLFFFIMLPTAYFGAKFMERKVTTVFLTGILIILLPAHIISHYGNQAMDYASPSTMTSWDFFHNKTTDGLVVGEAPFGLIRNQEKYRFYYLNTLVDEVDPLSRLPRDYPQYVCLTEQNQKYFETFSKPTLIPALEESLGTIAGYDLVYVSLDSRIYVNPGERHSAQ
jgi:hypothetical protein